MKSGWAKDIKKNQCEIFNFGGQCVVSHNRSRSPDVSQLCHCCHFLR